MKLNTLAGACLLAFATPAAFALNPATTGAIGTVKIYMSGASAQLNVLQGVFNSMCVVGTRDTYTHTGNVIGISCTIAPGISNLAGKNVFLSYNADGGSGQGVYPIAKTVDSGGAISVLSSSKRPQITNPAACTGASPNYSCAVANVSERFSDAGVSDVEPNLFKAEENKPSNFSTTTLEDFELANLDVGSQNQVIMGIAVTNNLYNDLAAAQGLSTGAGQVPSLPRAAVASLLSGALASPSSGQGWQALFTPGALPAGAAVTGQVNIGRRVNGSGTQAAANAYFLNYGCAPLSNTVPLKNSDDNPGQVDIFEGSGTSNVISFLNGIPAAQYGIGLISKENAPAVGANWKHVAIDGIVPNRDNVKNGKYEFVVEQTMQWNNAYVATALRTTAEPLPAGVTTGDLVSFLSAYRTRAGAPVVLDSIASSSTKEGVTALINDAEGFIYADTAMTTAGLANAKFVSRMTRGGNTCQPFTWSK